MHKRPAYLSANDIGKDFHSLFIFYFLAGGGKPTREGHMAKVGRSPTILGGFGVFHIFWRTPFFFSLLSLWFFFFQSSPWGKAKHQELPKVAKALSVVHISPACQFSGVLAFLFLMNHSFFTMSWLCRSFTSSGQPFSSETRNSWSVDLRILLYWENLGEAGFHYLFLPPTFLGLFAGTALTSQLMNPGQD